MGLLAQAKHGSWPLPPLNIRLVVPDIIDSRGRSVNAFIRLESDRSGVPAAIVQEYLAAFPPEGNEPEAEEVLRGESSSIRRRGAVGAPDDDRAEGQVDLVHQVPAEEGGIGLAPPFQEQLAESPGPAASA